MTKEWSLFFKGMALLLMLVFHLWNPFIDTGFETIGLFHQEWAAFGSICVSIFVFLSGYGIVVSNSCTSINNTFKRIKKLYLSFWKIWIIATPIILLLGIVAFDLKRLILEFFCINPSYNKMFWFIYLYVELIIFYYLYNKIDLKYKDSILLVIFLAIGMASSIGKWFTIPQISRYFEYMPCFMTGIIVAKSSLFSRNYTNKWGAFILLVALCAARVWIFYQTPLYVKKYIDFLVVPVLLWSIMKIGIPRWLNKIMLVFGKYSTAIWFIHGYYYYYYPELIYWPKYSILTFIWLATVSLLLAFLLDHFWLLATNKTSK